MNNKEELISVVIPTYKRNDTLIRALKSVYNQTYKNIEVIVVDDNAEFPDVRKKNEDIIKEFDNIVLIENEKNLGGGLTRNVGIEKAKGKYIAFLDDDDEFLPTKLEEQYNYYISLKNDNVAMIYCYANMINVDGNSYISKSFKNGNLLIENVKSCIAATSWWFCPKDKLLSVGGFENINSRQDASLLLKFFIKGYEAYCIPKVLLNYYWHDSNSGISKIDYKSVEAESKYRKIFIDNCEDICDKDKNEILYIFSYRLSMLYILLKNRKEAFKEFLNMIKIKKIAVNNFRVLAGIVFNNIYCFISKINNRRRGNK